jgi:hypothetical protein
MAFPPLRAVAHGRHYLHTGIVIKELRAARAGDAVFVRDTGRRRTTVWWKAAEGGSAG